MAYSKHTWVQDETIDAAELNNMEAGIEAADNAITAMSTATSEDVGKALKAKTVADGRVTAWEFGEAGGGGTGPMQIVKNMTELLSTTSDYVMVLNDNSPFGNGGPCVFYNQANGRTRNGYQRTNGTRVYPCPSTMIPPANAPKKLLTNVIKTWVGRTNIIHAPSNTDNIWGLFGEQCEADENDKFRMDCSDFVSAILLGITYDNSRYILGKDNSNIQNEMLSVAKMPSSNSPGKTIGGLTARELAQWFAEQGRLFYIPSITSPIGGEYLGKTLRFGDIIFGSRASSSSAAKSYFDIEHVMFVLGTMQAANRWYILVVQCTGDPSQGHEGTVCHLRHGQLFNSSSYYKVFARPNYRDFYDTFSTLTPIGDGKYTYDCFWLPSTGNSPETTELDDGILYAGHKYIYSYMSSTDYCPAIPGSVIRYTGLLQSSSRSVAYTISCYEYGENYNLITPVQSLVNNGVNSGPITLRSNTKYVQFVMQYPNDNTEIWYSDTDDFAVEVTPPSNAAS